MIKNKNPTLDGNGNKKLRPKDGKMKKMKQDKTERNEEEKK